ncbi:hypothetical protein [Treponema denticola]|uniref:hypothetical protein n=1 Tax=Treponema denticola TaxID=158 RepID=UPI0002B5CE5E|nr:hypothetical protein [Treponema denticola]EMB47024.1 hypothetical protein HMPREF9730_00042 [Treponema denticola AL-2]
MYEKLFNQLDKIHSIAIKGPVKDEPLKVISEIVAEICIAKQMLKETSTIKDCSNSCDSCTCDKGE